MTFKNITFLIGLAWLLYGATTFSYLDWDVGVSLVMAFSTYFTADKVIDRLRSLDLSKYPVAMLYTWFSVDGSYTIYWFFVDRSVLLAMRPRELGMMLLLAGLLILLGLYPQPVIDTASGTVGAVQHWFVSLPAVSEGVL